ncbi:MATE family efflux transporter [Roseovarius sp. LXJ103]|nr:MATE family efflux transporter [Roseovarius carneus]PWE37342.1 MATE family efflux transporter [Pelagicola sp. LXJ1103]
MPQGGATPPTYIRILREVRRLAILAFPIAVSLAAASLIGVVDTIMVAPLGTVPLAAVSLTMAAVMIFYSGLYGFVSAIGVRFAQAHGRGSDTELSATVRTGLIVAGVVGALGAIAMALLKGVMGEIGQPPEVVAALDGYWLAMSAMMIPFTLFYALKALFDAIDKPWVGVGLAFVAVALNVPANWVLIHGIGGWEGLGLLGAGLASLLSELVSLILALIIWRRAKMTQAARVPARRVRREMGVQVREGSIIAAGYVGEGGAYAVVGLMMGWFGAAALAANQIVGSVAAVLYMVPLGVSVAVSIRVAQAIGAGERERLVLIGKAGLLVIIGWMSLVTLALLAAGGAIAQSLSDDPEVVTLAAGLFVIVAVLQIADGVQGAMLGASRGMTDNRVPVMITLVCYWILALPVGYVLGFTFEMGPYGVWIGYGLGLGLAAVLLTWRFFRRARA